MNIYIGKITIGVKKVIFLLMCVITPVVRMRKLKQLTTAKIFSIILKYVFCFICLKQNEKRNTISFLYIDHCVEILVIHI